MEIMLPKKEFSGEQPGGLLTPSHGGSRIIAAEPAQQARSSYNQNVKRCFLFDKH